MIKGPIGDTHCNPEGGRDDADIDRLQRMAAYYHRLGCLNVAMALRALAEAKKTRRRASFDGKVADWPDSTSAVPTDEPPLGNNRS